MTGSIRWLLITGGTIFVGLILYWQLIIAEGTYLGQHIVTWLYDLAASRYDSIKGFDDSLEDMFLGEPITIAIAHQHAPLVLDIGTGTGRLPVTLLHQTEFRGQIVGVDDSMKMLKGAARKLEPYQDRVLFMRRSAMSLPFADNSFDAVTALEMLEFTPDPRVVLSEAIRVLCPGGLLVTTRRRGRDAFLIPGKTYSPSALSALLTNLGVAGIRIESWQMDYDLVWGRRKGYQVHSNGDALSSLLCPRCNQTELRMIKGGLICDSCGRMLPATQGVVDMS